MKREDMKIYRKILNISNIRDFCRIIAS